MKKMFAAATMALFTTVSSNSLAKHMQKEPENEVTIADAMVHCIVSNNALQNITGKNPDIGMMNDFNYVGIRELGKDNFLSYVDRHNKYTAAQIKNGNLSQEKITEYVATCNKIYDEIIVPMIYKAHGSPLYYE